MQLKVADSAIAIVYNSRITPELRVSIVESGQEPIIEVVGADLGKRTLAEAGSERRCISTPTCRCVPKEKRPAS